MRSYRGLSSFLYIVYSLFRLAINLVREPIARPAPLPMVGKQLPISCFSLVIRPLGNNRKLWSFTASLARDSEQRLSRTFVPAARAGPRTC